MTKQEEIRKEIEKLTENRFRPPAESAGLQWDKNFNSMLSGDILNYLHSQGVVIQSDRELPSTFDVNENGISALEYKKKLAGCAFVEPLIKEE